MLFNSCTFLIASFVCVTSTTAQTSTSPSPPDITYTSVVDQSAPFRLQVISDIQNFNGSYLESLHEGAAIESLGVYGAPNTPTGYNTFQLNTTRTVCEYANGTEVPCPDVKPTPPNPLGDPGLLTWNLPYNCISNDNCSYAPEVFSLAPRGVSSNMNFAMIFFPGDEFQETYVAFDEDGCMNLQDYLGEARAWYRWWICEVTGWTGSYTYEHLIWVSGAGEPDIGGCSRVDVKRVWA